MASDARDRYLSTLGVVQYRLRAVSNDRISRQSVSLGGLVAGVNPSDGTPGTTLLACEGRADIAPRGDPVMKPARAAVALEDAPISTSNSSPRAEDHGLAENSVAFRLACWRVGEDLMLIDSWPRGLGAENQRLQLLGNVLKSIRRKPEQLLAPEFIDWPIRGDTSLAAARAYLTVFVKGRHRQAPFKWLLAMGEDAAMSLGRGGAASNTPSAPVAIGEIEVIYTHSLTEMIELPSRKREVWRAIRFLAR